MTTKHTPTPWVVLDEYICDANIVEIANTTESGFTYQEDIANVAHIVKCVNMHDELVEALTDISRTSKGDVSLDSKASSVARLNYVIRLAYETLKKAGAL